MDIPSFKEVVDLADRYDKRKHVPKKKFEGKKNLTLFKMHITDYDYYKLISDWRRAEKIMKTRSIIGKNIYNMKQIIPDNAINDDTIQNKKVVTQKKLFDRIKKAKEIKKQKIKQNIKKIANNITPPSIPKPLNKKQSEEINNLKSLPISEALKKIDDLSDHTLIEYARQYHPNMYNDFTMGTTTSNSFRINVKVEIAKRIGIPEEKAVEYFTKTPFAEI
ncbi:hypothetical protein J7J90_03630 [Candidatus Micrarchaeota archaeon]|nr:hypothetical protein [Candidatus Micrarchaeota archaeon]